MTRQAKGRVTLSNPHAVEAAMHALRCCTLTTATPPRRATRGTPCMRIARARSDNGERSSEAGGARRHGIAPEVAGALRTPLHEWSSVLLELAERCAIARSEVAQARRYGEPRKLGSSSTVGAVRKVASASSSSSPSTSETALLPDCPLVQLARALQRFELMRRETSFACSDLLLPNRTERGLSQR